MADRYAELRSALDQTCHALLIDDPDTIRALLAERDALAAEIQEQARLLGGGAERELRLVAERDAFKAGWNAAIEAERKRRGEPVAWLYIGPSGNISAAYETVPNLDLYVLAKSEGGKIKPVYEAPQPAEPVIRDSRNTAEPVKIDSAGYTLGPVSDGGMDPRNTPCPHCAPVDGKYGPRVQQA